MNGVLIFVYIGLQVFIGIWLSRRMKSESDYFLGGRNVSTFMVAFSLFATWFGAETCMGSSGQVYAFGLSGSRADPFGYTICLFLMGLILAVRMRKGNYVTLSDYYSKRYGRTAELLSAWVLIPSSLIWAAAQLRAFGQIISATTRIPVTTTIILATLVVVAYTFLGGLLGDIYTDLVQGIILAVGLVTLLIFVLATPVPVGKILGSMEPARFSFLAAGEGLFQRFDRWLVPILGSLVAQESISRVLAARNPASARKASYAAAWFYFAMGSIPVFLGLIGPAILPGLADREHFLISLGERYLPQFMFILFAGTLVSAILSTVDSILLAVSALFSHNFLFPVLKITDEKKKVTLARLAVAGAGTIACIIALEGGGIYDLVVSASAFGTAGILVLTLGGFAVKRGGKLTAVATLSAGLVLSVTTEYVLKLQAPFLTSVIGSLLIFGTALFFEKRTVPSAVPAVEAYRPAAGNALDIATGKLGGTGTAVPFRDE